MTTPVTPTKKPRQRPQGFGLIAASNVLFFLAVLLILIGVFTVDAVAIAGLAVAFVAIVLTFVHASRRRKRMAK